MFFEAFIYFVTLAADRTLCQIFVPLMEELKCFTSSNVLWGLMTRLDSKVVTLTWFLLHGTLGCSAALETRYIVFVLWSILRRRTKTQSLLCMGNWYKYKQSIYYKNSISTLHGKLVIQTEHRFLCGCLINPAFSAFPAFSLYPNQLVIEILTSIDQFKKYSLKLGTSKITRSNQRNIFAFQFYFV